MPLRYSAPVTPPFPGVMPRPPRAASQGSGGGGQGVGDLIKRLTGTQGQKDQLVEALLAARTGSGPTVGQSYLPTIADTLGSSYLPLDNVSAQDLGILPQDLGMTDAEFSDAIGSARAADALSGFNWAGGV